MARHRLIGRVDLREDTPGAFDIVAAEVRKRQPPAGPKEKLGAEAGLKFRNSLADELLGESKLRRAE
jgi:hypothetical protein